MSKLNTEKGFDGIGALQKSRVHGDNVRAGGATLADVQNEILGRLVRDMTVAMARSI